MNRLALCSLAAFAVALVVPTPAAGNPSLRASPSYGEPGDAVTLRGRGWVVAEGCSNRVVLYFKQAGERMKLGRAVHGGGSFTFDTHYQRAAPGAAKFVARQVCADGTQKRVARVTVGARPEEGQEPEAVRYRGQTEHGGRVTFTVLDGSQVTDFRFMNRCATDRRRGSLVPGAMAIGDVSFARRGGRFKIRGRFRDGGVVRGRARELAGGCDSGRMTWRARRV